MRLSRTAMWTEVMHIMVKDKNSHVTRLTVLCEDDAFTAHGGLIPPQEQKQMLGERLFPLIQGMYPELATKITGMLLEIDNSKLVHMLEHQESLKVMVEKAVTVLRK